MTIDWPIVELGEHIDLLTGHPFKSKEYSDDAADIRLLRGDNVGQGYFRWEKAKRWGRDEYNAYSKFQLEVGDVILAMDRPWIPAGLKYGWVSREDLPALLVQRVARMRGRRELDTTFLRCLIGSPEFSDHVISITTGVNVPHISGRDIKAFRFRLPPLPTQRRIASILSAYDDLIENNTRRIAILEEMAQRLYEEWFVHFRFSGHDEVAFEGELPKGWCLSTVADAVERFTTGKKYNQKTVAELGAVPVLDQGRSGVIGYHNDAPGFDASEDEPVVVFANHTCYQRVVMFPFSTIQNVIPFKSSKAHPRDIFWLHHATNGLVELNDYKGHWPQFAAKVISIPASELTDLFGLHVGPMYRKRFLLERKNENLRAQRDLLLPKLVSGEIDVSEAEEGLEDAAA